MGRSDPHQRDGRVVLATSETDLLHWLAERQEAMLALLGELVNIDSGTNHLSGVEAVGARIAGFLRDSGLRPDVICGLGDVGRGLRVTVPGQTSAKPILLMGHLDTVFPLGEVKRRPFSVEDGRARGPGVADMKAGVVMNSFVLAAFQALGLNGPQLVGLYTGDEESGSLGYRAVIEAEAREAAYAFNAEPGRISGNIVTERRGGVFMRLSIKGKAAHSGIDLKRGVNAIDELAHKILALHALTDFDRGCTVNVGIVRGGQSVNTTAPHAEALLDLRYANGGDRDRLMDAINAVVMRSWTVGSSAQLAVIGEFVPLVATPPAVDLFRIYQAAAHDVGFSVAGEATGGCADSGFAAAMGAATLCGLGPVGGNAHSPDEFVEVETVVPRAQALALTILRVAGLADGRAPHLQSSRANDPLPSGIQSSNRRGPP
jgi:glutamate carboxypeptidase